MFFLQLSHTYHWIAHTYETLKSRCLHEININKTLQTSHTKGGSSFIDIGGTLLCPGFTQNCNRHGHCSNGNHKFIFLNLRSSTINILR